LKFIQEEPKENKSEMSPDFDTPLYGIPDTDEGYRIVLEERFGHKTFRAG
jgi:hypothetical protein